jgi:methylenetetrahydrofolate reductase (NADPH)
MAKFMKKNVAGMEVPDEVIKRLADTPKEEQSAKGLEICVESIKRLRQVEGIAGVHVMAIEWEQKVPEIVEKAGLLPRPNISG